MGGLKQFREFKLSNISGKIWYLILAEIAKKRHFFHFFCPGAKLSGAKLSWCQIVLVPNCPLLLSWCQIVRFYYLGAKLSPLLSLCQIVRCQIVLQSKSGTIFFISNIYIPKMKNKKKRSFILMRTQIGINLKCIAQCIC